MDILFLSFYFYQANLDLVNIFDGLAKIRVAKNGVHREQLID